MSGAIFGILFCFYAYKAQNSLGKFLKYFCLTPAMLITVMFAAFIAIYASLNMVILDQNITQSESDALHYAQTAILRIFQDLPGVLSDISSLQAAVWILVVSTIFFIVAVYKGYSWNDVYPFYAEYDKKRVAAGAKLEGAADKYKNDLIALRESINNSFKDLKTNLDLTLDNARTENDDVARVKNEINLIKDMVNEVYDQCRQALYGAIAEVRADGKNFNKGVKISLEINEGVEKIFKKYINNTDEMKTTYNTVMKNLNSTQDKILENLKKKIDGLNAKIIQLNKLAADDLKKEKSEMDSISNAIGDK